MNGEEVSEAKVKREAVAMCNVLCECDLEAEPGDSDTCIDDKNNNNENEGGDEDEGDDESEDEDDADNSDSAFDDYDSDSSALGLIKPSFTRKDLGLPYYVLREQRLAVTEETFTREASPPADTK